jgi:hypothetical protein
LSNYFASLHQPSLVVQTLEVVTVGDEHVIALVHGSYGALDLLGFFLSARHAGLVAERGTSRWYSFTVA